MYVESGGCKVINNLSTTRGFSDTLSDDKIQMNLKIAQGDWDKPKVEVKNYDWLSRWLGGRDHYWFESVLPTMPSFEMDMGSLYFFLTTNLLMPGKRVISIDASNAGGLRIPHDYYIVGKVVSH